MKNLEKMSPTEVLAITSGQLPAFKECVKYTLQDLVLRNHLNVYTEGSEDGVPIYYVEITDRSRIESCTPVEYRFLKLYASDEEIAWPLKDMIKEVVRNGRPNHALRKEVREAIAPYITRSFWQKLTGGYTLNRQGERLHAELTRELEAVRKLVAETGEDETEKLAALSSAIGANLMVAISTDTELMGRVESAMRSQHGERMYETSDSYTMGDVFLGAIVYDTVFDSSLNSCYDASCSETSGWSSGGGCSGDAGDGGGCSGCGSGCGGGCGGD
ncbi:hypothetical protein AB9P05_12800 [Roseivirga sp. BDSF3-8]|uniref:hypothetical protein n=1 Tax=Roseivirga sp. BDSF3-8 TaxID=3241598 RepID=UPI003531AAAD